MLPYPTTSPVLCPLCICMGGGGVGEDSVDSRQFSGRPVTGSGGEQYITLERYLRELKF
jgi:hypothetical protein